jgi:hypothetical protein
MPPDSPAEAIEKTAMRLQNMSYTPTLLIDTPDFLIMNREGFAKEYKRVSGLSAQKLIEEGMPAGAAPEEFRSNHLRLLEYHYRLLTRLRRDEPEAWDEVNELYEDD